MARRRKKRSLRPRVPARVKKRTKRPRSHRENELFGLALSALGLVLCAILYLGLDGGAVGSWLADALRDVFGNAAYVLPLALLGVGGLLLARSELLDVRPFRLGLGVGFFGLMVLLGKDNGGWIGLALGRLRRADRRHRRRDHRRCAALGGALLVSGASTGAILRRTGHVVRQASGARRALDWTSTETQTEETFASAGGDEPIAVRHVVDGAEAYPDVVSSTSQGDALLVRDDEPDFEPESLESVFETSSEHAEYRLDTGILRSPATAAAGKDTGARTAELLVRTLTEFGIDASVLGQISGPRVTRYELQLAPGRRSRRSPPSRRPLLRWPRPRSASSLPSLESRPSEWRCRTSPAPRHARGHLRRSPRNRERSPSGWARTSPATRSGPTSPACRTC